MTPSFIGLIATMFPGVRPSMSLASLPTASTRPFTLLIATIDGSLTTMPFPRAYTQVLAVPRSMARSLENNDSIERRLKWALLQEPGDSRQLAVDQIALAAGAPPPPRTDADASLRIHVSSARHGRRRSWGASKNVNSCEPCTMNCLTLLA